jgi:hypothetical protein
MLVFFALTVILRNRLFYTGLRGWTLLTFSMNVSVNLALTAAAPDALRPMYDNLKSWLGIDIFGLFGSGVLWAVALLLFGCYLLWNLGFYILDETYPAPFLIARTVSFSAIALIWLPILSRLGWINPPNSISKARFVLLCGLYYLIFLLVRMLAFQSTADLHDKNNWDKQLSIKGLIISTVIMAVLIIPYFKLIYSIPGVFNTIFGGVTTVWDFVMKNWWRALIAVAVIAFLSNIRSFSGGGSSGKTLAQREREVNERRSRERIAKLNQNTYGKNE